MEIKEKELTQRFSSMLSPELQSTVESLSEGKGHQASLEEREKLRAMGIVDGSGILVPPWKKALAAVKHSPVEILIIRGVLDKFSVSRYYLSSTGGEHLFISALADTKENQQIAFPFSWEELVEFLDTALNFYGPSKSLELNIELDYDEFSALIGFVDALKAQSIRAMVERRDFTPKSATVEEVFDMVGKGTDSKDNRWLVPLLENITPMPLVSDTHRLNAAMSRMGDLGIFASDHGNFTPSEKARPLIGSLLAPVSCCAVSFTGRTHEATQHIDYLSAIRTTSLFLLLRFQKLDSECPKVLIDCDYAISFMNELNRHYKLYQGHFDDFTAKAALAKAAPAEPSCLKCKAGIPEGSKFCPKCGAPAEKKAPPPEDIAKKCAQCTTVLAPDMLFCPSCGTPREAGPPPAPPPVVPADLTCSRCGAVAGPGKKFCTKCGAPVAGGAQSSTPPLRKEKKCAKCGSTIEKGKKFCTKCGTPAGS
ncbi:MAG: zinc ribbon domain-containing protein [Candidatus Eremiobacteraeota bacterium]|nr:zinc ribbon domain-containing protein [Candidatus Eremiobacteraeota bacterium]